MTCSHWPRNGRRCEAEATRRLYAPDGKPIPGGFYCREHAEAITSEYREKLGEDWPSVEVDELGRHVSERRISTYSRADLDREARAAVRSFKKTLPEAIRGTVRTSGWELVVRNDGDPFLRAYFEDENGRHFVSAAI